MSLIILKGLHIFYYTTRILTFVELWYRNSHHHKDHSHCPFIAPSTFLLPPSSWSQAATNLSSIFVFVRSICHVNIIKLYNSLGIEFSTQHNSPQVNPGCHMAMGVFLWWRTSSLYCLWLLCIKLLWTFMHRFSCERKFSILWDKCPGVQLLGRIVVVLLLFFVLFCFNFILFLNFT